MDDASSNPGHDASPVPADAATTTTGGVDPTLIRWMLSLTPEARLRWLENVLQTLRVLSLQALAELKKDATSPKDQLSRLMILETLRLKQES
jgi:hypothetical protein